MANKDKKFNIASGAAGQKMYNLIKRLYPICRSITGEGARETLKIISQKISIKIHEVPSGTKVFDWTVPKEWNIKDAYVKNHNGKKVIDFKKSNIHVLNYSIPVKKKMKLKELKSHLFTLPDYPDWIPYLTSYYKEEWGFCLSHKEFKKLKEGIYEVFIDSTLKKGNLTYGELYLPGRKRDEILLTCYICHPSLCNDNLSGVALLTFLANSLKVLKLNYSYRFLFIPETIGAITWLKLNEAGVPNIKLGLVVTCVGDSGDLTYKKTRAGDTLLDKAVEKVLSDSGDQHKIIDFFPSGSDERQFSSPGFKLKMGSLMRTPYGCYPEYHTSADNLDFVKAEKLQDSLNKYLEIIYILETNAKFISLNQKCEPQLGRRGIYSTIGGKKNQGISQKALLWVLNFSDGEHSLLDIAARSGINFRKIKEAADLLLLKNLLKKENKTD